MQSTVKTEAITDQSVASMKQDLHRQWVPRGWNSAASHDAIWHFAHGVGDDNPLWWDSSYAEASPLGHRIAPPTFLYSCDTAPVVPGVLMDDQEPGGVEKWLPGALGLWAGDRWVWHNSVDIDEPVTSTAELWDVRERKSSFSGRSIAQVTKTSFFGRGSRPLGDVYRTLFRFERSALAQQKYMNDPMPHYTEADRQAFRAHYLAEGSQRRGAEDRLWEEVSVGDTLPRLLKGPLTTTSVIAWMMGWGSAQAQTDRIRATFLEQVPGAEIVHPEHGYSDTIEAPHWDVRLAAEGGFPRGYDFGCQRVSWLAHSVTDWCGDTGQLRELDGRINRPNFVGDTTWIAGRVTEKTRSDEAAEVTCVVEARNQRDEVTATATVRVSLPTRA